MTSRGLEHALRLYKGSIKDLFRLHEGSMKALFGTIKALPAFEGGF